MESVFLFTLCYILFCLCFVFPPAEIVSVGLTVESLFSFWLESESHCFIHHHIKRTVATLITHSCIPLGYVLGIKYLDPNISIWDGNIFVDFLVVTCFTIPIVAVAIVLQWYQTNWANHPIAKNLRHFTTPDMDIRRIARDIDEEYRRKPEVKVSRVGPKSHWQLFGDEWDLHRVKSREFHEKRIRGTRDSMTNGTNYPSSVISEAFKTTQFNFRGPIISSVDKIIIKCNALTRVVATDNWIIRIRPYSLNFAHQNDASLVVSSSDSHLYTPDRPEGSQYLSIDVRSGRPNVDSFRIRINSADFKDLQDKVIRPINIMENVDFHGNIVDCFLRVFKEHIKQNPKVLAPENLDVCVGCLLATPNVKIMTSCGYTTGSRKCTMCHCKPLWCADCLGKWFASRQDQKQPNKWLSSKATCPMCRSVFCLLDVCLLVSSRDELQEQPDS